MIVVILRPYKKFSFMVRKSIEKKMIKEVSYRHY
jgi:hypothetical protein